MVASSLRAGRINPIYIPYTRAVWNKKADECFRGCAQHVHTSFKQYDLPVLQFFFETYRKDDRFNEAAY